MPKEERDKEGRLWEQKRKCPYCEETRIGEDLGLVHRDDEEKEDWAICFWCIKKVFDKVLGKEVKVKEFASEDLKKCAYCEKNEDKYLLNADKNNNVRWFICFECVKKAFDKILKGK